MARQTQKLKGPYLWALVLIILSGLGVSGTVLSKTYANPVDLDYRYNFEQLNEHISYRTGADPVSVAHQGHYYLFLTLADGYLMSDNLVDWSFITPTLWPAKSIVAPAVSSDGKRLIIMSSRMQPEAILQSRDPEHGKIEYLTRLAPMVPDADFPGDDVPPKADQIPPGPWDPGLFRDDDGQWYLYWNSSNVYPIYGIKVDPGSGEPNGRFAYSGHPTSLIRLDPDHHGWERFGRDHSGGLPDGTPIKPFIEGAWMTKVAGKYYLQYGGPGTEYNAYATGAYVSDKPLGPFIYAPYNPVGYKPGGFVQGAGHGNTFQDRYGNWWNTGTPWVGYNWNFERRIGLWPTRFDADGQMEVDTRFGDFPHTMPNAKTDDFDAQFTGWMLLSYGKKAWASSRLKPEFTAANVTDENPRTLWVAAQTQPGETLTLDLGARKTVRAIQVNFGDYQSDRFADGPDIYTEFRLDGSLDGKHWTQIAATETPRRDRPNAYFELSQAADIRYVRYVHGHVGAAHLAISDIRVFGSGGTGKPKTPVLATVTRDKDPRNAHIVWKPVPGAVGYNVRWGIKSDRLSLTYQVFADHGTHLELRALNDHQAYWVAVEAFDERGVSSLSAVMPIP